MGLPKPRNKDEWIFLAKQRVINVLQRRIAANIRQLEVKISESGPPDKRPEPHILATALKTLMASDEVKQYKPKGESSKEESVFYTLTPFYPDVAKKRVDELLVPYRIYRMLADKEEYCSQVLENIASASFQAAGHYTSLGKLPSTAPLDGVYQMESHKIGNEVKNAREWVYPHSGRIWVMIRKCLEIEAVPFLLARKLPFVTRAIFSRIGILGFELHRQVFSPVVAEYLRDIQNTNKLGYKDVIALDQTQPHPALVAFLQNTLPRQIAKYYSIWVSNRDLLLEYAVKRNMGDPDMSDQQREPHYKAFARNLFYEDELEEDSGDESYYDF